MLTKRIPVLLFILLFIAGCSQNNSNTDDITFRRMSVSIDYQGAYVNSYNRSKVFYAFEAAGCSLFPFFARIPEDTIPTGPININNDWREFRDWANDNMHHNLPGDTMYVHIIYIFGIQNYPTGTGPYLGITYYDYGNSGIGHEYGGGPNSISAVFVATIDSFLVSDGFTSGSDDIRKVIDQVTIHELGHQWANLSHCDTLHDCAMSAMIWQRINTQGVWELVDSRWLTGFCDTCNQKIKNDIW